MMHTTRLTYANLVRHAALVLAISALAACEKEQPAPETAAPVQAEDHMGGMQGMPGMQGAQSEMVTRMNGHMQAMQGVGADSLRSMLPMHRQMVANMIAQMNREMRDMNMTGDAQWNATLDSLRTDLVNMPEMNDQELQSVMPAHRDRVMNLMQMHEAMMQGGHR